MQLILSYSDGRRTDAAVLAVSAERMRISIPDCDDIIELKADRGGWVAEDGTKVEIEAMVAGSDVSALFAQPARLAKAAVN